MNSSKSVSLSPTRRAVFLSYARRDGKRLARDLHDRLEAAGHSVWQDVFDMGGGEDWWLQIEEQIHKADALLLLLTRSAVESEIVRREWVHARRRGIPILPVTDDPEIFQKAPRWMRKVDVFVLTLEGAHDQLKRLYEQILEPPTLRPIPFMVPPLPLNYVSRERDHHRLIGHVLDEMHENPVFRTVVVYGPPGFGKTTIMQAISHDPAILDAFTGGILWAEIGEGGRDVISRLNAVVSTLTGRSVAFDTAEEAARRLDELLENRDCLLVLDDVWNEAHIRPFLGSSRCARFVTTRDPSTCMPKGAVAEPLGEMLTAEAANMLGGFLPLEKLDEASASQAHESLSALARRLGAWPLLLNIFGGALQNEVTVQQASIAQAVQFIEQGLNDAGLTAFDSTRSKERSKAMSASVSASLRTFRDRDKDRLYELAAFCGNHPVQQHAAARLWEATSHMPAFQSERLLRQFAGMFFQLSRDRESGSNIVRFHHALREYLAGQLSEHRKRNVHRAFLDSYNAEHKPWYSVKDDGYLFRRLAYHLSLSGRAAELYQLIDRNWMVAQLRRTGSNRAFLDDVDTAMEHLRSEASPELAQVFRAALIKASVGSFATNLPPAILATAARLGRVQTACDYAAILNDKVDQAEAYRLIAETLMTQGPAESVTQVLEQALLAADQTADAAQRARLMGELARTVARNGGSQWARQLVDEALTLARRADLTERKADSLAAIGSALVEIGDLKQALPIADELLAAAKQAQVRGLYIGNVPVYAADARGLARGAYLVFKAGQLDRGIRVAGEAHQAAQNILARTDASAAASVLCEVGRVYHKADDPVRASQMAGEACALARSPEARSLSAVVDVARLYEELDRNAEARTLREEALSAAQTVADDRVRMAVLGEIANMLLDSGERARGEDIVMRVLTGSAPIEATMPRTVAVTRMAEVLADAGQIPRATIIAKQALNFARAIPDRQIRIDAWNMIGGVLARGNRPARWGASRGRGERRRERLGAVGYGSRAGTPRQ